MPSLYEGGKPKEQHVIVIMWPSKTQRRFVSKLSCLSIPQLSHSSGVPAPGRGVHGVPTRQALKEKQQLGASDGITSTSPLLSYHPLSAYESRNITAPRIQAMPLTSSLMTFFLFLGVTLSCFGLFSFSKRML